MNIHIFHWILEDNYLFYCKTPGVTCVVFFILHLGGAVKTALVCVARVAVIKALCYCARGGRISLVFVLSAVW